MTKKTDFENIALKHAALLFRYAYWLTGKKEIAEDLVQETFLRAWKNYDTVQNREGIKSWLITILRHENARRFEGKQLRSEAGFEIENIVSHYVEEDNRPEAYALRHALDTLPEDYKEPLLLKILCGYSTKEIAEILGVSPEAVTTRLYRAKHKLKDQLTGIGLSLSSGKIK